MMAEEPLRVCDNRIGEKDLTEQKHLEQHSPILSPQGTGSDSVLTAAIGLRLTLQFV